MTETDLVTAGSSSEEKEPPSTVTSEFSSPVTPDVPIAPRAEDSAPKADVTTDASTGSLSSMVLPELRALANSVGVKGASGMRKSELIAAIRESRGESTNSPPEAKAERTDKAENAADDSGSAPADTVKENATPTEAGEQQGQQRRERRGASRNAGAAGDRGKQASGQDAKDDADSDKNADKNKNSRTPSRIPNRTAVASRAISRATSRVATTTTTAKATAARDAVDVASATAGAVVNGAATAATPSPNCARTMSSSPSRAFSTCSTTTRSSARRATSPVPTTSTCR